MLRDTRGASLLFILAITFLLLSLGVSVLTAAGLNFGATAAQRDRSQLDIYASSMERVVKVIIEEEEDNISGLSRPVNDSRTLVGLILHDVLTAAVPQGEGSHYITGSMPLSTRAGIETIKLPDPTDLSGENLLGNVEYDVVVSWTMSVRVPRLVRCVRNIDPFGDIEADPCMLFVVEMGGMISVTVTTTYASHSGSVNTMTTITTYMLDEVKVEELDTCAFPNTCNRPAVMGTFEINNLRVTNLPQRSIIQHEKGIG